MLHEIKENDCGYEDGDDVFSRPNPKQRINGQQDKKKHLLIPNH